MATSLHQTGSVVVGYFATAQDAHRAINALIDEGFVPSEIGAAFQVSADGAPRPNQGAPQQQEPREADVGGSLREELGTTFPNTTTHAGTSFGAAASDSTAVQPGVIGGGAGTQFGGAGRPGPITGSSLVNSGLPSELKSELPHDSDLQGGAAAQQTSRTAYASEPALASGSMANEHEGWLDKLKNVFGGHARSSQVRTEDGVPEAPVTAESQNFGTGEGHLILDENTSGSGTTRTSSTSGSHRYSQPAFESSFSSYGVEPGRARHLSQRIGQGGAIVTVQVTTRATEAERLLEAHGGEVRSTESNIQGSTQDAFSSDSRVEVFGTVSRDYPGYIK